MNRTLMSSFGSNVTWIVDGIETQGRAIIEDNKADDDLSTARVRKRYKEFRIRAIECEIEPVGLKPHAKVRLSDGAEYDIYSPVESNRYGMAYIRLRSG